ncbi:MAG TPA: ATP-binding protein, partial [candidate division Zixibacteria bacterium]|nr:ATP-binding protein [candidate division Zixibacteria bacterium]
SILRQVRTDFARDNIEISFEPADKEYPVLDDGIGFRQAFLNLIINARDTYKDGGQIRIELTSNGDEHRLQIVDRGGGIKKELKKRLFEPFSTTKAQGSGLGLYVAKKLIEQNGGRLDLRNNNEGGATAEIILPAYKEQ